MERSEAIERAQAHLVAVLSGERSPFDVEHQDVYDVLYEVKSAADNYDREARLAIRDLERSLPYVRGESGSWNSLGNVQRNVDMYAAVFSARVDVAKKALVNYYLSK